MNKIIRADVSHLDMIAPLFDSYRQFYEQEPGLAEARNFIEARLKNDDSAIYLALNAEGSAIGFTQLYPSFCSIAMRSVWVLNDLYVNPDSRRHGIARALMNRARDLGVETSAAWLRLETAVTNSPGQALYESQGWKRDEEFFTYYLVSLDD
jgi:ribosomal protein S18 acetylase RimI-like enzyme